MRNFLLALSIISLSFAGICQESIYLNLQKKYRSCNSEDEILLLYLNLNEEFKEESHYFLNMLAYASEQIKYNPRKAFDLIQENNFNLIDRTDFERGIYAQTLGEISIISENPSLAIQHLKSALIAFEKSNSKYYIAKSQMSIGRAYTALGVLDSGLVYLHNSAISARNEFPELHQLIILNKAVNRKIAGAYNEAEQLFTSALDQMKTDKKDSYLICRTQANLAEVFMLQQSYFRADSLYQRALTIAIDSELKGDQYRIFHDLGQLAQKQKDYKKSLLYHLKADSIRSNVGLITMSNQMGQLQKQYDIDLLQQKEIHNKELLELERRRNIVLVVALIIVLTLIALLIIQVQKINQKNRILVSKINKNNDVKNRSKSSEHNIYVNPLILALEELKSNESYILQESLTLEKLAKKLNTNRSYLSEAINVGFNSTFSQWINQIRIEKACELLSDPTNDKYSFETIAKMVGFISISSFNTNFKRITGITPSYFKNNRLSN